MDTSTTPWSVALASDSPDLFLSFENLCMQGLLHWVENDHNLDPLQVNMAESEITRMTSDYADNELELFRKTVRCFF